jgi:flagellar motor switch protein FliG
MSTQAPATALRKVALVLASLDAEAADALIDRMSLERAKQVRQALLELQQIDPSEQAAVVSEFLRQGQAARQADLAGVEIEAGLAKRLELPETASDEVQQMEKMSSRSDLSVLPRVNDPSGPDKDTELFSFLHRFDADELAAELEHERPQTLAVLISYLPAERSADLLSRLSSATRAEVLRRVAELGDLDPQMVSEVHQALHNRLSQPAVSLRPRRRGAEAVATILDAADDHARDRILESLAAHQPALAARFAPPADEPTLTFDELARLPELAIAKVFAECDSHVLTLALAGAHPTFARRVCEQLPTREGRQLRRQLDSLGPLRLSDVERAQQDIVEVARRLHAAGRIELRPRRGLSLTI